jgi:D-threo-aldose 1-dehydrogenase
MALDLGQWDCMMLAGTYSVLQQTDGGLLDRCHTLGVSVLVAAPFMSGALAGGKYWKYGEIPPAIAARIARLREICDGHGVPIEALALQFPLAHPAVAAVVTGRRSPDEVSQNVARINRSVPPGCWDEIAADGFVPADSVPGRR